MPIEGLKEFSADLNRFFKDLVPHHQVLATKKIVFTALKGVVMKTPRKTGRAAGNWQLEQGNAPEGTLERTDKSGETIQDELAKLGGLQPYTDVYLVNNLPYIRPLEEGHSDQAPQGMLAVTVEELRQMFS